MITDHNCKTCGGEVRYCEHCESIGWMEFFCSRHCWEASPRYLSIKQSFQNICQALPVENQADLHNIFSNCDLQMYDFEFAGWLEEIKK